MIVPVWSHTMYVFHAYPLASCSPMVYHTHANQWAMSANMSMSSIRTAAPYSM